MSILENEFNIQCVKFIKKCRELHDHSWSLFNRIGGRLESLNIDALNSQNDLNERKLMLKKIENLSNGNKIETSEYNVIFNEFYGVPVLYLCVSDQNGCPIQLEDFLTTNYDFDLEELGQSITQTEHPFLFTPFYMIHPCRTFNFMKIHKSSDYLLTWLSTVGTLVNLKLDIHLFMNKPIGDD